jgi:hypothetical protein
MRDSHTSLITFQSSQKILKPSQHRVSPTEVFYLVLCFYRYCFLKMFFYDTKLISTSMYMFHSVSTVLNFIVYFNCKHVSSNYINKVCNSSIWWCK